jgi:tRNA 2-selenouridine synthase
MEINNFEHNIGNIFNAQVYTALNMSIRLQIDDFLSRCPSMPVLDVRSPGEFIAGHIPLAVQFPLFTDQERAIIGTLYDQEGRNAAVKKGMELVGPKLKSFIESAESFKSSEFALYCWRGGMRSESMAWLLDLYGFKTHILKGGYKSYRNHLSSLFFDRKLPLRVITGYTGSAKTEILHILGAKGEQFIDLEHLANHKGSCYGSIGSCPQPTAEHFQNLVFEQIRKMDLNRPVWIEDEGLRIGQVWMPEGLFHQINESPHFFIEMDVRQRIKRLVKEYGSSPKEQLIDATRGIAKKLGLEKTNKAIELIQLGQMEKAVEIILIYYDTMYHKSIFGKSHLIVDRFKIHHDRISRLADQLILKSSSYAISFDRV